MIYYSLIRSGSNEVISIFEWDEIASGSVTASITFPSGTYLQEVSASASFTSSADYGNFVDVGVFGGFFTGSVFISEYDTLNINNNFLIYSPDPTNSGSINLIITGSVSVGSGSLNLSSSKIIIENETVNNLQTDAMWLFGETQFGRLRFDAYSTAVTASPLRNYFRFEDDMQVTDWQSTDIRRIALSGHNLTSGDSKIYENKLNEIIRDAWEGSTITLTQVDSNGETYKTFTILSGSYIERRNTEGSNFISRQQEWGTLNVVGGVGLSDKFNYYDGIYNQELQYYPAKYYEFYVTESASATGSQILPDQGDHFFVNIENNSGVRLNRYEFKTSDSFTIPKWAKKTTVICVGAGGGGGSGMVAWSDYWEPFYKHVTDNAEKIDCASITIGGGGGAGGNVKFKTFNSTELPPGSKCSIQIGTGGFGGSFTLDSIGGNPRKTALECKYFGGGCFDIWVGEDGNNGGDSVFALPNGESVVGRGGLGGHRGLGIPSLYVQYFLQRVPALVPGGLNYLKKDAEGLTTDGSILSGGPGGFGISVVDPQLLTMHHNRIKNRTDNKRMREYADIYENINSAPSLPYKNTTVLNYTIDYWDFPVSNPDNPDILMPYGYIYNPDPRIIQGSKEAGMQYVNGSSDIPSFNAPTGGGGGTGDVSDGFAKFFHLDKNFSEKYANRTITHAEIDNNTVDLYPYQKIGKGGKRLIQKDFYGIQFGEGGDGGNLVTLGGLSEVTASYGGFPGGGGGGGGSIVFPSQNSTDTWHGVVNDPSQVTPSNVSNKMRGGYGADGLVVVIVEG